MAALRKQTAAVVGALLSLFILYTGLFGEMRPLQQRAIPFTLAMVLIFLLFPSTKSKPSPRWADALDVLLAVVALGAGLYVATQDEAIAMRMGDYTQLDAIVSTIGILLVLEVARRTLGWAMTNIALVSLAYMLFGKFLPGDFGHRGFSFISAVVNLNLSQEGVYGVTLETIVSLVYMFILLGAFMEVTGTGDLLISLAYAVTGKVTGGPALAAVVSSALFGTLSGSAVANVTSTGTYTIPLMKKSGYPAEFAGAVEAVASAGGAIMPPVMGAGAFLIAQYLGLPYGTVALRATIPAVLYYLCLGVAVHLRAKKMGLVTPAREGPALGELMRKQGYLLIPLVILIALFLYGLSPTYAAVISLGVLVVLNSLFKGQHGRIGPKQWLEGLISGANQSLTIFGVAGAAGIVIGTVSLSGIGIKFSMLMVQAAAHSLLLGLIFAMLGTLVLGMGLPPIASYVLTVAIAGNSLAQLGGDLFAIHLFIFYFASMAVLTPPVAIAAYTAAGIAGSDPFKTGWQATRLGLAGFLVPFMFIYGKALILVGSTLQITTAIITAAVGTALLAASVEGYLLSAVPWWGRVLLGAAALGLIDPGLGTDLMGLVCLAVVIVQQVVSGRKQQKLARAI